VPWAVVVGVGVGGVVVVVGGLFEAEGSDAVWGSTAPAGCSSIRVTFIVAAGSSDAEGRGGFGVSEVGRDLSGPVFIVIWVIAVDVGSAASGRDGSVTVADGKDRSAF